MFKLIRKSSKQIRGSFRTPDYPEEIPYKLQRPVLLIRYK